jgi:hypothetical protein
MPEHFLRAPPAYTSCLSGRSSRAGSLINGRVRQSMRCWSNEIRDPCSYSPTCKQSTAAPQSIDDSHAARNRARADVFNPVDRFYKPQHALHFRAASDPQPMKCRRLMVGMTATPILLTSICGASISPVYVHVKWRQAARTLTCRRPSLFAGNSSVISVPDNAGSSLRTPPCDRVPSR